MFYSEKRTVQLFITKQRFKHILLLQIKKSRNCGTFLLKQINYYVLTVFAKSAPALNLATFFAEILIAFPV